MMKIFLKFWMLFLISLSFEISTNAKPVPPGSGEGDVPANILLLLDSSASMNSGISGQDKLDSVARAVVDTSDNFIVTQNRRALVGYNSDLSRNKDFNNEIGRFIGELNHNCSAVYTGTTGYSTTTKDTRVSSTHITGVATGVSTDDGKVDNENVFFVRTNGIVYSDQSILGLSEDGTRCLFYINVGFFPQSFDYKKIGDEHFLFISGETTNRRGAFTSFNINRGERAAIHISGGRTDFTRLMRRTWRSTVNSDASQYFICKAHIHGFGLERVGNVYNLASTNRSSVYVSTNRPNVDTQLARVQDCYMSQDDDSIMYTVSQQRAVLQKIRLDTTTTYTVLERAGKYSRNFYNLEAGGTLAANSVRFKKISGVFVTSDKIMVSSINGTVDVFNENLFTTDDVDSAWRGQFGGGRMSRWIGLKKAISAIVSDTTLTTGAHFGYGHWNAGEHGGSKYAAFGGRRCHFNQDQCSYYGGWDGVHPEGTSVTCNNDSCLNVGISAEGYTKILDELLPQVTAWGTDGRAYSQMARDYFLEDFDAYDPDSECQLNYVIVIGDGMIRNWNADDALPFIEELRNQTNPIKTLFVAYGGGINPVGMARFRALAQAGSCPGGDSDSDECEEVIEADTPEMLKTELTSKIRQILAERLSFTAPSITATVQEGGSLYQAQFEYEQYGEWKGTILRKTLKKDGTVDHKMSTAGNWDAAKQVLKQAKENSRNIWTVGADLEYLNDWNNFKTENSDSIEELFGILNYEVLDYHNTTSYCATKGYVGEDGIQDDVLGLINFVRGEDYFDYDGDCKVTHIRDHVLGDIYHSQLIEIGPPDASVDFTGANEEAYFRAINNYQSFKAKHATRRNVIFAGSNTGMLHAFNAKTGDEEWAFIPPFIAGLLPTIINPSLSHTVTTEDDKDDAGNKVKKGGTNAIFGVDGSPIVHDVFIKGFDQEGEPEDIENWHTILIVPYGRGGAGFSVLDVTNPILKDGLGPIHMYSVFNDSVNNRVMIADHAGNIDTLTYSTGSVSISDSVEAERAYENFEVALEADGGVDSATTTAQDLIAKCQTNTDVTGGFSANGTASCFKGKKFTFDTLSPTAPDGINVPESSLIVSERIGGTMEVIDIASAKYVGGQLVIEFNEEKVFNPRGPDTLTDPDDDDKTITLPASNSFNVAHSCTTSVGIPEILDYSQLGETWSTPRIAKLPSADLSKRGNVDEDQYVAIMGAGMGSTNLCAGSAVYMVNLSDSDTPAALYGYEQNSGPLTIVDTDPADPLTPEGSDIGNSLPAAPVVITPDTAFNIPWRGAMVYFNDLEGKITKINLTDSTANNAQLFSQTTLFTLNANTKNKRYSYFKMDAGIGGDTRNLWLFGGTGNFQDIGGGSRKMDNILYGVKDPDYPEFKHLNQEVVPEETDGSFVDTAMRGANNAFSIDDAVVCADTTGLISCNDLGTPTAQQKAWVIHLDEVDDKLPTDPSTKNTYRKLSAPPTLFKGNVYFPIYEPPTGIDKCNIGMSYICVANDECGTNTSHLLTKGGAANGKKCKEVRAGILSQLVIFGDMLFANVAGPKEDEDTLYRVTAAAGEVSANRSNWRDSGF